MRVFSFGNLMIKEQLAATIQAALEEAKASGELPMETIPAVGLEMPKNRAHGDWASNVALILAPALKMPPREVAARLVARLPLGGGSVIARADIAGPGFINFTLRPDWLGDILRRIESEGEAYGRSEEQAGRRTIVEFVSANPNGPITVAHGRNAAIGDALCSLLEAVGGEVLREHYINDALNSTQMNNFGKSVFVRYQELLGHDVLRGEDPDWIYRGEYVKDIAQRILDTRGAAFEHASLDDPQVIQTFRELSQEGMVAQQRADLEAFGVYFDSWYSEATLHADGRVEAAIEALKANGHTYEKDGALWLRSTDFGNLYRR